MTIRSRQIDVFYRKKKKQEVHKMKANLTSLGIFLNKRNILLRVILYHHPVYTNVLQCSLNCCPWCYKHYVTLLWHSCSLFIIYREVQITKTNSTNIFKALCPKIINKFIQAGAVLVHRTLFILN